MSREHQIIYLIFNNFANLFLCINASIDLILYCFLSEKFARTFKQMICNQCSTKTVKNGPKPRLMSLDPTSIIAPNSPSTCYHQQLAANTTNKYYGQLHDIYRNSSGWKKNHNKKPKKKSLHSITTNTKSDNHIFYQNSLSKNTQYTKSCNKAINVTSNPVLDYIDENDTNDEIND